MNMNISVKEFTMLATPISLAQYSQKKSYVTYFALSSSSPMKIGMNWENFI